MIDWAHLHQIADGNTAFELELLQLFTTDTHTQIKQLRRAIALEDFLEIKQIAHHIKGASANMGITSIQTTADLLEEQVFFKEITTINPFVESLEQALKQLEELIESLSINN
ncbi:Hpt domain-containing protein [Oscillatoria sp. FACHB-1407]|uniref:Hpt domain-containing protein n=1 Tax=Oscillatoria sp. FACHB-1407 TaxID=2692847 RepID=UPI0016829162|nr:Hpt domain-containing protein [Oscillatoria sp. FACHB-1407]MBD2462199.1 Hpt domain-containing protein [Oscillatoria sp. FACHB-1407]